MKKLLPILLLVTLFAISCDKKENNANPEPDRLLPEVVNQLDKVTNISDFNGSLKELLLNAAETEGGITIFAPQDFNIITNINTTTLHIVYTEQQLKDHIVKGKYTLADLRGKTTLTALSGKTLNISSVGGVVKVNDIAIVEHSVYTGNSGVVHVIEKAIGITYPETGELEERTITESEFRVGYNQVKQRLDAFQKSVLVMDALLSNEASPQQASQAGYNFYADFHAFKFSPSSNCVADVWNKGYQVINIINDLLRVKSENFNDKINLFAGLKTIRAFTYLTLLNYYGNIMMVPETAAAITTPLSNTNNQQIIAHIDTDLSTANTVLEPLGKTPEINTYTVQALKAKLALNQKKYEQVRDYTHSIILSKAYTLENKSSIFNVGSKEIIWQLADITNTALKNFLNNRPTFPLLRLAEMHLMYAEAQLALGNPDAAAESLTPLLERQNLSGNITEALLHQLALEEMSREGVSFINMRRWGIAEQRLNGFNHPKFNLLPIPASTIQISPYFIQNEGYP